MSAIEGEVKEEPLGGGDFKEPALFDRLLESPLVDILAALFRLNRPIPQQEQIQLDGGAG